MVATLLGLNSMFYTPFPRSFFRAFLIWCSSNNVALSIIQTPIGAK